AGSRMGAAYEAENAAHFATFGVAATRDKRRYGGESLYPKMAFAMNLLVPYFDGSSPLADLHAGNYVGQPAQRYLKISWGFAKDVVAEVARPPVAGRPAPSAEKRNLATVTTAQTPALDAWITGLVVDAYLGDTLDTPAHRAKLPGLLAFANALLPVLTARAGTDEGLSRAERRRLRRMPTGSQSDRETMYSLWRNLHFKHVVADAAARGVRYAGMGLAHLQYLQAENAVPRGANTFDMQGAALAGFERRTRTLERMAP
ncbi:MAG TPA: hypothetical protein VGF17_14605, partial [Phytomonospora sp.]